MEKQTFPASPPLQIQNIKNSQMKQTLRKIFLKIQSTNDNLLQKIFWFLLTWIIFLNWYIPVIHICNTSLVAAIVKQHGNKKKGKLNRCQLKTH